MDQISVPINTISAISDLHNVSSVEQESVTKELIINNDALTSVMNDGESTAVLLTTTVEPTINPNNPQPINNNNTTLPSSTNPSIPSSPYRSGNKLSLSTSGSLLSPYKSPVKATVSGTFGGLISSLPNPSSSTSSLLLSPSSTTVNHGTDDNNNNEHNTVMDIHDSNSSENLRSRFYSSLFILRQFTAALTATEEQVKTNEILRSRSQSRSSSRSRSRDSTKPNSRNPSRRNSKSNNNNNKNTSGGTGSRRVSHPDKQRSILEEKENNGVSSSSSSIQQVIPMEPTSTNEHASIHQIIEPISFVGSSHGNSNSSTTPGKQQRTPPQTTHHERIHRSIIRTSPSIPTNPESIIGPLVSSIHTVNSSQGALLNTSLLSSDTEASNVSETTNVTVPETLPSLRPSLYPDLSPAEISIRINEESQKMKSILAAMNLRAREAIARELQIQGYERASNALISNSLYELHHPTDKFPFSSSVTVDPKNNHNNVVLFKPSDNHDTNPSSVPPSLGESQGPKDPVTLPVSPVVTTSVSLRHLEMSRLGTPTYSSDQSIDKNNDPVSTSKLVVSTSPTTDHHQQQHPSLHLLQEPGFLSPIKPILRNLLHEISATALPHLLVDSPSKKLNTSTGNFTNEIIPLRDANPNISIPNFSFGSSSTEGTSSTTSSDLTRATVRRPSLNPHFQWLRERMRTTQQQSSFSSSSSSRSPHIQHDSTTFLPVVTIVSHVTSPMKDTEPTVSLGISVQHRDNNNHQHMVTEPITAFNYPTEIDSLNTSHTIVTNNDDKLIVSSSSSSLLPVNSSSGNGAIHRRRNSHRRMEKWGSRAISVSDSDDSSSESDQLIENRFAGALSRKLTKVNPASLRTSSVLPDTVFSSDSVRSISPIPIVPAVGAENDTVPVLPESSVTLPVVTSSPNANNNESEEDTSDIVDASDICYLANGGSATSIVPSTVSIIKENENIAASSVDTATAVPTPATLQRTGSNANVLPVKGNHDIALTRTTNNTESLVNSSSPAHLDETVQRVARILSSNYSSRRPSTSSHRSQSREETVLTTTKKDTIRSRRSSVISIDNQNYIVQAPIDTVYRLHHGVAAVIGALSDQHVDQQYPNPTGSTLGQRGTVLPSSSSRRGSQLSHTSEMGTQTVCDTGVQTSPVKTKEGKSNLDSPPPVTLLPSVQPVVIDTHDHGFGSYVQSSTVEEEEDDLDFVTNVLRDTSYIQPMDTNHSHAHHHQYQDTGVQAEASNEDDDLLNITRSTDRTNPLDRTGNTPRVDVTFIRRTTAYSGNQSQIITEPVTSPSVNDIEEDEVFALNVLNGEDVREGSKLTSSVFDSDNNVPYGWYPSRPIGKQQYHTSYMNQGIPVNRVPGSSPIIPDTYDPLPSNVRSPLHDRVGKPLILAMASPPSAKKGYNKQNEPLYDYDDNGYDDGNDYDEQDEEGVYNETNDENTNYDYNDDEEEYNRDDRTTSHRSYRSRSTYNSSYPHSSHQYSSNNQRPPFRTANISRTQTNRPRTSGGRLEPSAASSSTITKGSRITTEIHRPRTASLAQSTNSFRTTTRTNTSVAGSTRPRTTNTNASVAAQSIQIPYQLGKLVPLQDIYRPPWRPSGFAHIIGE